GTASAAWCATPPCTPRSAPASRRSSRRSVGPSLRPCRRRSKAATATASSSSGRGVVDRLAIVRLGHRGDGIADGADGPIYVPYTLPGETIETEPWPDHPDRRHLVRVDAPSPERIAPICPHFGTCGGCALQHWDTARYRAWKRDLLVGTL